MSGVTVRLHLIPSMQTLGQEKGYTLNRSPVYHTDNTDRLTFTSMVSFVWLVEGSQITNMEGKKHEEDMQTPHRSLELSHCEATVQTTASPVPISQQILE